MILYQCDNCDKYYVSEAKCPHCDCAKHKHLGKFSTNDINWLLAEHTENIQHMADRIQTLTQDLKRRGELLKGRNKK